MMIEETHFERVIELVKLLLQDITRISELHIPIKSFLFPDMEKILELAIELYNKNSFLDWVLLTTEVKDRGLNYPLYVESGFYGEVGIPQSVDTYKIKIKTYEGYIIENYKDVKTRELNEKYNKGLIERKEYDAIMKKIIEFNLENDDVFRTIADIPEENEIKEYVKSGIKELDNKINGFPLGALSVWSGGNGGGKSSLLNQLALESINQNYKVAIYSGELSNNSLLNWIRLQAAGVENLELKNNQYKVKDYIKDKINYWLDKNLYLFDNDKKNTVDYILSGVRELIENKDVKVVIVDNLMSIDLEERNNKYDEQTKLVKELSKMAKKYKVHIHFVCHPRKTMTFLRKNDISGTADITNLADNVFIMHRVGTDFIRATKEMYDMKDNDPLYDFSCVCEICKNRDLGIVDTFIGMHYEKGSRRLLNSINEKRFYGWMEMRS